MQSNQSIESLTTELIELSGNYMFPEYYSHRGKLMWKILNPYTSYQEEKLVLCPVEEGLLKSLVLAIFKISEAKIKIYQ